MFTKSLTCTNVQFNALRLTPVGRFDSDPAYSPLQLLVAVVSIALGSVGGRRVKPEGRQPCSSSISNAPANKCTTPGGNFVGVAGASRVLMKGLNHELGLVG
jgi:hypothetical protein